MDKAFAFESVFKIANIDIERCLIYCSPKHKLKVYANY